MSKKTIKSADKDNAPFDKSDEAWLIIETVPAEESDYLSPGHNYSRAVRQSWILFPLLILL